MESKFKGKIKCYADDDSINNYETTKFHTVVDEDNEKNLIAFWDAKSAKRINIIARHLTSEKEIL